MAYLDSYQIFKKELGMNFPETFSVTERIDLLERWIIVTSYIYYELDDCVISDHTYNRNTQMLLDYIRTNPEAFERSRYYEYFKDFQSGTGYDLYYKLSDEMKEKVEWEALYVLNMREKR